MQVCFSLVRPYAVGPVNLCLFGGGQTTSGLTICGPSCGSTESCESTFYQKETVCVPVTVSPFAHPGTARTICCGDPVIHTGPQCPGSKTSCTFTVTQSLCIQIPIAFGAVIETGEASVQCGAALTDALNGQGAQLGHAGDDGHRAYGDVAAVAGEAGAEADGEQALRREHDEGRDAQPQHRQDDVRAPL